MLKEILTFLKEGLTSENPIDFIIALFIACLFVPVIVLKFRVQIILFIVKLLGIKPENKNDEVGREQCEAFYESLIEGAFWSIHSCYFYARDYIIEEGLDPYDDDDEIVKIFNARFDQIEKLIRARMSKFKFKNKSLTVYLNKGWNSQFLHTKNTVYNRVIEKKGDPEAYLRDKQNEFISDFAIWITSIEEKL